MMRASLNNVTNSQCCDAFSVLVTRANDWLHQNPSLRSKTCESIEVKGRYDGVVDTNKSCYFEADHSKRRMRNLYIRALRSAGVA